jgi:chromosome segregation protein
MHIKKLEICGFKSFVDRTVIHFDHDVIGIVGPNGCGKSNVVDAIRWVMGEQSAKALRGRSMVDVVFNGSDSRPAHGFAEVTLTFDNSDAESARQLPLEYRDYPEIAVTRRMYRDATSEYLINKVPVRLRDVTEVFLGTGVGRKAYSIVEQGKIGLIVSARPEDRRILIEEAAGITKYKARKKQAEQKMQLTRQNLARVSDIVAELERQLATLKRQAAKAERYLRYRREIDDLMLWEASHRLLELICRTDVAEGARAAAASSVEAQRAQVDAQDAEVEVLRQNAHTAEQQAEQTQNAAFHSDNLVREHETHIERASDRYQQLVARLQAAREEQSELERKAQELATEREQLELEADQIEAEQATEETRLAAEAERLAEAQEAAERSNERVVALRQVEAQTTAKIAAAEATITGYEQRRVEMEQRSTRLREELETLVGEATALEAECVRAGEEAGALGASQQIHKEARDELEAELPALRQALVDHDRVVETTRTDLHRDHSRLRALEELAERMEGLGAGVRHLLETRDPVLRGLVADRIEVPEELTAAFTALVGDRLQCVVVSDAQRGVELLQELAQSQRGRATIIAATPRRVAGMDWSIHQREGVVGYLIDQLGCRPEDEPVLRALVDDAIVVRTVADAARLQSTGSSFDMVTLDGTVFHADGRISGGTADGVARGIIDRKREIDRLREVVAERREALTQALVDHERLRERMRELRTALEQAAEQTHTAEIALVKGEQDLRRARERLGAVTKRRATLEAEIAELGRALQAGSVQHEQAEQALELGRDQLEATITALGEAEQVAHECRDQLSARQQAFTERKVLLARARERATSARSAWERVGRSYDELRARADGLEGERHGAAQEAGRIAATLLEAREQLFGAKGQAREAQTAYQGARGELDDARHSLGIREAELRELRAALNRASGELQTHVMELQRLTLERSHLEEGVRERFRGLELRTIVGDYHARAPVEEEQRNRIRELHELIDRMGPVHLEATKECDEVAQRYQHFTEQHQDLTSALADLDKAIAQMNRESRRLFRHAFDGINTEFQSVFPKLFRGGKAELRLTHPDDLLETGIEILAQPPGKKLGNIELMSGGEKAFTAVALLFAIFNYKPSPFCILDEVDAPLDEANIGRYIENVRAMTDRSQFIVITHSKRTMQSVDVLYGVTMQEPGVSKLVGVRVNAEAKASGLRSERQATRPPPAAEAMAC